jgi:hypothetical protein
LPFILLVQPQAPPPLPATLTETPIHEFKNLLALKPVVVDLVLSTACFTLWVRQY